MCVQTLSVITIFLTKRWNIPPLFDILNIKHFTKINLHKFVKCFIINKSIKKYLTIRVRCDNI